jgi:hypothetical protein
MRITKNNFITFAITLILLICLIASGYFVWSNYFKEDSPEQQLTDANSKVIQNQDHFSKSDKILDAEYDKHPLFQILPYTDGYIYISTTSSPYNLLIQYTTTLDDANKQYASLITKYKDDIRNYNVVFRKTNKLVEKD